MYLVSKINQLEIINLLIKNSKVSYFIIQEVIMKQTYFRKLDIHVLVKRLKKEQLSVGIIENISTTLQGKELYITHIPTVRGTVEST